MTNFNGVDCGCIDAGVEDVKADISNNKLTVIGKVDPTEVRDKLAEKTKKKVELVSPQPKKDAGAGDKKPEEKSEKKADEKKTEDKKPKEVNQFSVLIIITSVVLPSFSRHLNSENGFIFLVNSQYGSSLKL